MLPPRGSSHRRTEDSTTDHLPLAGLFALAIIGCALRVWELDSYALSPDDALHVAEARLSDPSEFLSALAREDTHPPLHYLLLHALVRLGAGDLGVFVGGLLVSSALVLLVDPARWGRSCCS